MFFEITHIKGSLQKLVTLDLLHGINYKKCCTVSTIKKCGTVSDGDEEVVLVKEEDTI